MYVLYFVWHNKLLTYDTHLTKIIFYHSRSMLMQETQWDLKHNVLQIKYFFTTPIFPYFLNFKYFIINKPVTFFSFLAFENLQGILNTNAKIN